MSTRYASTKAFFTLPLVGPVRAGLPQPADAGQAPGALRVEDLLIDHPDQTIYYRVKGDSMRDVRLLDGNIAVDDQSASRIMGDEGQGFQAHEDIAVPISTPVSPKTKGPP